MKIAYVSVSRAGCVIILDRKMENMVLDRNSRGVKTELRFVPAEEICTEKERVRQVFYHKSIQRERSSSDSLRANIQLRNSNRMECCVICC